MHNTKIGYMYRDASNYKQQGASVLKGEITAGEKKAIRKRLEERLYFIPSQVGLPDFQEFMNSPVGDDDHVWHELQVEDITITGDPSTLDMNIHELVAKFKAVKKWDVIAACELHGIPPSPEMKEYKMLKATPYKKLPLLINRKWVDKENEKLYRKRIAEGT